MTDAQLVKCAHCGQWVEELVPCRYCGAPVGKSQTTGIGLTLADTLIELASSHEGDFRGAIRSAVRALWNNEWSLSDFLEQMSDAIDRYYEFAWQEGAAAVDVTPEERTDEEQIALYRQMSEALPHISGYAQAIIDGGKANGGALGPLLDRAELWVKRYNEVRNLAMQMAKRDAKLEWVIGPTEEHCPDCSKYNGRVYRASVWGEIRPQHRSLKCHGYQCQCEFVPNSRYPATPGKPPRMTG